MSVDLQRMHHRAVSDLFLIHSNCTETPDLKMRFALCHAMNGIVTEYSVILVLLTRVMDTQVSLITVDFKALPESVEMSTT